MHLDAAVDNEQIYIFRPAVLLLVAVSKITCMYVRGKQPRHARCESPRTMAPSHKS